MIAGEREVLSTEKIAESVVANDQPGESSSSESEVDVVVRKNVPSAR